MAKDLLYTRLMNSPEWREIRAGMQEKHPFCELHEKRGIKVPATCIHHIREVESGQTEAESRELCYNPENLIALCAYCHNEIHKRKRSHSRENVKQRQRNRTARIIARWESKVTGSVEAILPSGYYSRHEEAGSYQMGQQYQAAAGRTFYPLGQILRRVASAL